MQALNKRCATLAALLVAQATLLGFAAARGQAQTPPLRPGQAQTAGQFLRAVLRGDYVAAYRKLAPEVQRTVNLQRFALAARPLWKRGKNEKKAIELYKLGVRLGDGGASRLFYSFSFVADSLLKPPPVLLEVTFRDTASRAVLGFAMRVVKAATKPTGKPKTPGKK